jgi:hypothetical protein
MRGQVAKHLQAFKGYVEKHGADRVRAVLTKGKCKDGRITFCLNKKDRFEMLQALGLAPVSRSMFPAGTQIPATREEFDKLLDTAVIRTVKLSGVPTPK